MHFCYPCSRFICEMTRECVTWLSEMIYDSPRYSIDMCFQLVLEAYTQEPYVTATHCNALQHAATHCNTLVLEPYTQEPCVSATHCNTLQRTATHCNTLQHTRPGAIHTHAANTLQHTATLCKTLCNTLYNTLQHTAMHSYQPYIHTHSRTCTHIYTIGSFPPSIPTRPHTNSNIHKEKWEPYDSSKSSQQCCSVLQCVAVCCSALQCVAVW